MKQRFGFSLVAVATVSLVAALGSQVVSRTQSALFPHVRHARVFPVCEGCHAGIVSGVAEAAFPSREDCGRCHDGVREDSVAWRSRGVRPSNLQFSHTTHAARIAVAGDSVTCHTCHAVSDTAPRMAVVGPQPDNCVRCHAHRVEQHFAPGANCLTCHVPVAAATALAVDRIGMFPQPDWHRDTTFSTDHGRVPTQQQGSCAVCHARESCERCHANAERVALIASLPRDARVAALVAGKPARYEAPGSHAAVEWRNSHGQSALAPGSSCANCHTQPSCAVCHAGGTGSARDVIANLPGPGVREGLGVSAGRIDPVHPSDIAVRHGSLAASGGLDCAQCHAEQMCTSCHAAQDSRRFHASNFVERHAVEVFGSGSDCQTCHSTERFCRDCHARSGIASDGRMNAAFHTGKSNWVLSHGQAARTGMESCASCHRQADCIRCHSASGGWGVNPHGRGFQANARASSNAASCRWCHIGPLPGGHDD